MTAAPNPLALLDAIPPASIPAAIAYLADRMALAPKSEPRGAPAETDVLTADEVAKLLKVDRTYVYAHRRALGGKRLGERKLRFSRRAITARLH